MTESRSSGSSDSISTDLIAKLFHSLPDERPSDISEIEFCVFRLFSKLSGQTQNYSLIFLFFMTVSLIQTFACLCFVGNSLNIENNNLDFATRFIYFAIKFRPYSDDINSIYLYIINLFCICSILTFFVMLYQMHKRVYIQPRYKTILTILVVDIPRILIPVLTINITEFVFKLISLESRLYICQTVLFIIFLIIFLLMLISCSNTMYSSIFYYSGIFSSTSSIMFILYINMFLIFAHAVTQTLLFVQDANYVLSFALLVFGLFLIFTVSANFYLAMPLPVFLFTHGFVLVIAGLISVFETSGYITNYTSMHFTLFCLEIVGFIIIYKILNHVKNKLTKKFLKIAKKRNFKRLGKISDVMTLNYLYFAIHHCHPCIDDSTFLNFALKQTARPSWCLFKVYHLLSFLQKVPPNFDDFTKSIKQNRQISQVHRFILYEADKLAALRTITQVPPDMETKMSEFETRLSQYQQLRVTFMTEIAHNNNIGFIFLNALSTMKNYMLTNYTCTLRETYPNSPDVLRLYAQYLSIVCQNQVGCSRWTTIADDIQKRVLQYADYTHVNVLFRHPILQLSMMKHNSTQASAPLVRPRAPSILLFPTLHDNKSNLFGTRPNNHFDDKKSIADLMIIISGILYGLSIIAFFVSSFAHCKILNNSVSIGIDFTACFSEYYQAFSRTMYYPLLQLINGTTETVDTLQFNIVYGAYYGYAWTHFNHNYTIGNRISSEFKKSFSWIQSDSYNVPSYDLSVYVNTQLEWILSRYTNLLQRIFPLNGNFSPNVLEVPVFLQTLCESYSLFSPLLLKFLSSYEEFNNNVPKQVSTKILYSGIPLILFAILLLILPPFALRDIKKLSKYFPKTEQGSDHHILHLYLKRDFTSFWQIYLSIISTVVVIVIFSIINVVSVISESKRLNDKLLDESRNVLSDSHLFLAASSALNDILLTQVHNTAFVPNLTLIINEINSCLDFLVNGSYIYSLYEGILQESFLLLVQMTYQVSSTSLQYNRQFTQEYLNIYVNQLTPVLLERIRNNIDIMYHDSDVISLEEMNINIILLILIIIIYIIMAFQIEKLHLTMKMLMELLSGLSESSLSLSKTSSLKKRSVLDLVSRPCALIDKSTRVIATNQLWLSFYDESFDGVIGRTIGELANTQEFNTYDVGHGNQLIVMSEVKEEAEAKNDLKNTKRDLRLLKSVSIPKRFLEITEGLEIIDFLVVCKVQLVPVGNENLSAEIWINDAVSMETWITDRCQACEDCDVLYESFRDITLLFGVNQVLSPHMLIISAINIIVDLLRWTIEWEWNSGSMCACVTMSCGSPVRFVFTHDKFTRMEAYGPPFEKQMRLREHMELNSIVCCEETAQRIKDMKIGFELTECGMGAYTFAIQDNFYRPDLSCETFQ